MLDLTDKQMNQARILTLVPLILGIVWSLLSPDAIQVNEAVAAGKAAINIDDIESRVVIHLDEHQPVRPERVFINSATHAELRSCPGIGSGTAHQILLERKYGKFIDWRDLSDRVKGITPGKVEKLQDAGVRLDMAVD